MGNYHVVKSTKSVGVGILLTLFLGPIGLFYSSVLGGFIMTFGPFLLLGIALWGVFIESDLILVMVMSTWIAQAVLWWLICMIWSIIAIKKYNRRIISQSNYKNSYYPISQPTETPSYLGGYKKQIASQESKPIPEENLNLDAPNIRDWLKANPNKGINDYYKYFKN